MPVPEISRSIRFILVMAFVAWLAAWFHYQAKFGKNVPDSVIYISMALMVSCGLVAIYAFWQITETSGTIDRWWWILAAGMFGLGPSWGLPTIIWAKAMKKAEPDELKDSTAQDGETK